MARCRQRPCPSGPGDLGNRQTAGTAGSYWNQGQGSAPCSHGSWDRRADTIHIEPGLVPGSERLGLPALILTLGNPYPGRLPRAPGGTGHPPPRGGLGACRHLRSSRCPSWSPLDQRGDSSVLPSSACAPGASVGGRSICTRDQSRVLQGQDVREQSFRCADTALGFKEDELQSRTRPRAQHLRSTWFPRANGPSGTRRTPSPSTYRGAKVSSVVQH